MYFSFSFVARQRFFTSLPSWYCDYKSVLFTPKVPKERENTLLFPTLIRACIEWLISRQSLHFCVRYRMLTHTRSRRKMRSSSVFSALPRGSEFSVGHKPVRANNMEMTSKSHFGFEVIGILCSPE